MPYPPCFRGGAADPRPPSSSSTAANTTTSVYQTRLGLAALTWSRTVVGVLPSALTSASTTTATARASVLPVPAPSVALLEEAGVQEVRSGAEQAGRRWSFAWDLTRARFASGGTGSRLRLLHRRLDLRRDAPRRRRPDRGGLPQNESEEPRPEAAASGGDDPPAGARRREPVVHHPSGDRREKARKISIDLTTSTSGGDPRLCFAVDGKRVLQVKRLRWKFRGNEKIEVDGVRIQVSWDVHGWLFDGSATASAEEAQATAGGGGVRLPIREGGREEGEKNWGGILGRIAGA
ncbi:hypothetical protein QJS10_CPB17g00242 [Acorus calamus]|uniref:Uncharacterized protein n=1 Tax=Acorus calamus TaxID=4465 RepID=A0AAV9CWX0_ACOCL|nr:hypothetical protein QJS10_CPB17g00242 [Acorus calamus]